MKHKTGKTLALLLALVLLVGLLPGITAYAEAGSESFDTTTSNTYTGDHFTITSERFDSDGIYCRALSPLRIDARNNETITGVDLTIGFYGGYGRTQYLYADHGTLFYTTEEDGDVISFLNVNSPSVEISSSISEYLQFSRVVVYYSVPETYSITVHPGANGAAGVSPNPAEAGTVITVNCVPFQGYAVSEILWSADGGVTKTDITDTASFVMPAANVDVWVNFAPAGYPGGFGGGSGFGGGDDGWYAGAYTGQRAWKARLAPMANGAAALGIMTGESTTTEFDVYPNTSIYVFPNPDPGYTLDKIVWSTMDGTASYDITQVKNFVMPAMDVMVYVNFRPIDS